MPDHCGNVSPAPGHHLGFRSNRNAFGRGRRGIYSSVLQGGLGLRLKIVVSGGEPGLLSHVGPKMEPGVCAFGQAGTPFQKIIDSGQAQFVAAGGSIPAPQGRD